MACPFRTPVASSPHGECQLQSLGEEGSSCISGSYSQVTSKYCLVSSKVLSPVGPCSGRLASLELLCRDESACHLFCEHEAALLRKQALPLLPASPSLINAYQCVLNVLRTLHDCNYWGADHPRLASGALGVSSHHAHVPIVLEACPLFGGLKIIEVYLLFSHFSSDTSPSSVESWFTLESCI